MDILPQGLKCLVSLKKSKGDSVYQTEKYVTDCGFEGLMPCMSEI